MVVGGDVTPLEVERLAKKWFEPIPVQKFPKFSIPQEDPQLAKKTKSIRAKVPTDAFYKAFKMPAKGQPGYLEADLASDLLGFGRSSILEQRLVKTGKLFASVGAYILGSTDPGLWVFSGKMEQGIPAELAEKALDEVINDFLSQEISPESLQKIKNQGEAMKSYESIQLLNRVMNLAFAANMGSPDLYWSEFESKSKLETEGVMNWANRLLREDNASVLYYQSIAS